MPLRVNPFQQIYFTELIKPKEFANVFSPLLMQDTLPLFQPGNIILEGTQGSGKSMLLALLKPEIRIAYKKAGKEFPVPGEFSDYIGAGINLIRSAAVDFGERINKKQYEKDSQQLPRFFGDFVNYWIIEDILFSLTMIGEELEGCLANEIGLRYEKSKLDDFARLLSKEECWFDYLHRVRNFEDLKNCLKDRIRDYREFLRGHSDLPDKIIKTTTNPGEPISQTARALWGSGVILDTIPLFIRIDQCEEMVRLEAKANEQNLHFEFRAVVNKMLGTRDPSVSYRLGGRKYAFRKTREKQMYGTTGQIEDFRNFKTINLDEILRRRENVKTWVFPKFAEDVFQKRLQVAGYSVNTCPEACLASVLGGTQISIKIKVKHYAGSSPGKVIKIEQDWPEKVKMCLEELSKKDVLSAKLGEAWTRQQMEREKPLLPTRNDLPWQREKKRWWKKERMFLTSLQVAATRAQKMIWARRKDVLDLSGGNILIFLSICQHIWTAWLRSLPRDTNWKDASMPCIDDIYIQSEGIEEASDRWYDKIREEPDGDSRRRFVSFLGTYFRNQLRSDKKMSYPGHNGISLSIAELENDPEVYNKLQDASAYGVMVDIKHTPKTKGRGESRKWYLHSILSPHFQIPAIHTKEPKYVKVSQVRAWLEKAKVLFPKETND